MFKEYQHLRIPGPTPVSPEVQREMGRTILGHRSEEFSEVFNESSEKAKYVFNTQQDVFIVAASGSGSQEMAVANVVEPGDKVLVVVTGVFGERFVKINKAFKAEVVELRYNWGVEAKTEDIKQALEENPDIKAVFVTQCDTSTSVTNDIKAIGQVIKDTKALLVVDSVSGIGAMDMRMDDWSVDIAVTASQKALGVAPGLSLISVSEKAWKVIKAHEGAKFYWDLNAYKSNKDKGTTPYTAPVSLIFGLSKSLDMIIEEGLENVIKRHVLIRDMLRAAIRAMDLSLLIKDENVASTTVTVIEVNDKFDVKELIKVLNKDYRIVIAGGQGSLSGKIFRIGHMGYIHPLDILTVISGLEMALNQVGYPVELGAGVRAAEEVWCDEKGINKR